MYDLACYPLKVVKVYNEFLEQESKMERQFGVVRKIKDTYGFISCEDGDRFFHFSALSKKSIKPFHFLRVGDRVTFLPKVGEKNQPQAEDVEPVPNVVKENKEARPS